MNQTTEAEKRVATAFPASDNASPKAPGLHGEAAKNDLAKQVPKLRPRFLVEAVTMLAADTADGDAGVGGLGSYLKRTNPACSPKLYGHSGLLDMIKTYDLLTVQQQPGGHWSVRLATGDIGEKGVLSASSQEGGIQLDGDTR
jgi:hypothetical protein